jgi:hypothetical protein
MVRLLLSIIFLLSTSSCGTLFGGKTQNINLMAIDGGALTADITTSEGVRNNVSIPGSIKVKRSNEDIEITVKENNCYKPTKTFVESRYNLFSALNFLSVYSSSSSTTTDYLTGGLWSYDKTVYINTRKKKNKICD